MNKLEECARAIDPEPWQENYKFSAATKAVIRLWSLDKARAVIRRLIELTSDESLRAMLQSVLDEDEKAKAQE